MLGAEPRGKIGNKQNRDEQQRRQGCTVSLKARPYNKTKT